MVGKRKTSTSMDCMEGVLSLEASDLTEAYEKGQLKGRLKEIAATLDEEANPVIMLIKHKK